MTQKRSRVTKPVNPEVITISRRHWNQLRAGKHIPLTPKYRKRVSHRAIVRVQIPYAKKHEWALAFVYSRPIIGSYLSRKMLL